MSYTRAGNAAFWIISAFVSGLILNRATGNYRYVFPAAALFGILSALQFGAIKVRDERKSRESLKGMVHIMEALRDKSFQAYLLTYSFFEAGLLFALPVVPLVLVDQVHISNLAAGVYGSVFSSMWLAGFFFWGRFLDRHSVRDALMAVFFTGSFMPLIYIFSRNIYTLGIAQGISGFVAAALELAGYVVITRISSSREVPHYMAANVAAGGVRGMILPFAGTGLYTVFGARPVFIVSFVSISIAFLTAGKLIKHRGL
jgi:predicted MFS family arabinose efflux permease